MQRTTLPVMALALIAAPALPASAAPAAQRCPATEFNGFLAAFLDNPTVQRNHVTVPLNSRTIDPDTQPEPAPVDRLLRAGDIRYPLVPGKAERTRDGLVTTIKRVSATDTDVKLAKPDTGYQKTYRFRRAAGCWTLVAMNDESL